MYMQMHRGCMPGAWATGSGFHPVNWRALLQPPINEAHQKSSHCCVKCEQQSRLVKSE